MESVNRYYPKVFSSMYTAGMKISITKTYVLHFSKKNFKKTHFLQVDKAQEIQALHYSSNKIGIV